MLRFELLHFKLMGLLQVDQINFMLLLELFDFMFI